MISPIIQIIYKFKAIIYKFKFKTFEVIRILYLKFLNFLVSKINGHNMDNHYIPSCKLMLSLP